LQNDYIKDNINFQIQPFVVSQKDTSRSISQSETKEGIKVSNQHMKNNKSIAVFEGFFDFLTYQTIHQNQQQPLTNFLILNSLAFF